MSHIVADKINLSDTYFTIEYNKSFTKKIIWEECNKVIIETNDSGPFMEDVFFVFVTAEDHIKIPQTLVCSGDLEKITAKFPGFDYESLIQAMGSTKNDLFLCWEKSQMFKE